MRAAIFKSSRVVTFFSVSHSISFRQKLFPAALCYCSILLTTALPVGCFCVFILFFGFFLFSFWSFFGGNWGLNDLFLLLGLSVVRSPAATLVVDTSLLGLMQLLLLPFRSCLVFLMLLFVSFLALL